jgi:hypothetical protein
MPLFSSCHVVGPANDAPPSKQAAAAAAARDERREWHSGANFFHHARFGTGALLRCHDCGREKAFRNFDTKSQFLVYKNKGVYTLFHCNEQNSNFILFDSPCDGYLGMCFSEFEKQYGTKVSSNAWATLPSEPHFPTRKKSVLYVPSTHTHTHTHTHMCQNNSWNIVSSTYWTLSRSQ